MASTHIAHDCFLGDNVIMSKSTLGGHVELGDWVVLGGGVLVHQFTKIGAHAFFVGGGFRVVQDVPPFIIAADHPLVFKGINSVGLKRRGFNLQDRIVIKKIYKIYFLSGSNRKDSIKRY